MKELIWSCAFELLIAIYIITTRLLFSEKYHRQELVIHWMLIEFFLLIVSSLSLISHEGHLSAMAFLQQKIYMSNRIFIVSSNVGIPPSSLGKQIQRYTNSFQSSGLWKILEWPPFFLRNIIKHICDLIAVRMVIDIIGPHIIGPQRFLGRWNDFQSLRRTYHSSTSV